MTETTKPVPKINANQGILAEHSAKHVIVNLNATQTISGVLETPEAWTHIQNNFNIRLNKGDRVTVVSHDGLALADQVMVVKAERGHLWFSAPLRMVSFEAVTLYETDQHAVVTQGVGYSVKAKRGGRVDDKIFPTPDAAKHEILRRMPTRVAS